MIESSPLVQLFMAVHRLIGVCQQAVNGVMFMRVIFDLPDAEFNVVSALYLKIPSDNGFVQALHNFSGFEMADVGEQRDKLIPAEPPHHVHIARLDVNQAQGAERTAVWHHQRATGRLGEVRKVSLAGKSGEK